MLQSVAAEESAGPKRNAGVSALAAKLDSGVAFFIIVFVVVIFVIVVVVAVAVAVAVVDLMLKAA